MDRTASVQLSERDLVALCNAA